MASPSRRHQRIVGKMFAEMDRWNEQNTIGSVELEVDVALPTGMGFIPDLIFIKTEQVESLLTPEGKIRGAPYLVVEVISPNTRTRDTVHKMRAYYEAGVAWYWLIDSETLTAQEYQHTPEGYLLRTVASAGELFEPKALKGLQLNLQELVGEE